MAPQRVAVASSRKQAHARTGACRRVRASGCCAQASSGAWVPPSPGGVRGPRRSCTWAKLYACVKLSSAMGNARAAAAAMSNVRSPQRFEQQPLASDETEAPPAACSSPPTISTATSLWLSSCNELSLDPCSRRTPAPAALQIFEAGRTSISPSREASRGSASGARQPASAPPGMRRRRRHEAGLFLSWRCHAAQRTRRRGEPKARPPPLTHTRPLPRAPMSR